MSYENQTTHPTYEHLLKEMQSYRDELALMKRMYEDLYYNLDYDNFSSNLYMDAQKFLLTYKEVYPNGAKSESSISITAEQIQTRVSYEDLANQLLNYSTITQTANNISLAVNSERSYVTNLLNTNYYTREQTQSQLSITASGIYSNVSATYETKSNANANYNILNSSISQTATSITQTVNAQYGNPITVYYPPPYSDRNQLYYYNGLYYYWNGSTWAITANANFGTVFQQTAGGFTFKGNVSITGNMITSGTITGTALQSMDSGSGKEVYINNGMIIFRYYSSPMGGIYYDNTGVYPDNQNRVFVYSAYGQALKLQSGGNMSIEATNGNIVYGRGKWEFSHGSDINFGNLSTTRFSYGSSVIFNGATVDFTGANVIGLPK